MSTSAAGQVLHGQNGRAVPSSHGSAPVADIIPLCHYDDGELSAAYITLAWGEIGWCKKHLAAIGDWPARCFEEMVS